MSLPDILPPGDDVSEDTGVADPIDSVDDTDTDSALTTPADAPTGELDAATDDVIEGTATGLDTLADENASPEFLDSLFSSLQEVFGPMVQSLIEALEALLSQINGDSQEGTVDDTPVVAGSSVGEAVAILVADSNIAELRQLPGGRNNYFMGGLTQEMANNENPVDFYGEQAASELADLVGRGVETVFNLSGTENLQFTNFLNSDYCVNITPKPNVIDVYFGSPESEEQADHFWSDPRYIENYRLCHEAYSAGNSVSISEFGPIVCGSFSCIMYFLSNPTLSYEEVVAQVAPDLKDDASFIEVSRLLISLMGNPTAIEQITDISVSEVAESGSLEAEFNALIEGVGGTMTQAKLNGVISFLRANPTFRPINFDVNFQTRGNVAIPEGVYLTLTNGTTIEGNNLQSGNLRRMGENLRVGPSRNFAEVPDGTLNPNVGALRSSVVIPGTMYLVASGGSVEIPNGTEISGTIGIGLVS